MSVEAAVEVAARWNNIDDLELINRPIVQDLRFISREFIRLVEDIKKEAEFYSKSTPDMRTRDAKVSRLLTDLLDGETTF